MKAAYTDIYTWEYTVLEKRKLTDSQTYTNPTTYLPINVLNITYMNKKILQLKFCTPATSHVVHK